ncbi:MAG: PaaI family thioesterase [Myxococcota bacterium]|nr:PaaI family thioesterase [Myxococcota bacterium]
MSDGEGRSGHWDSPGTKASGAWVQRRRLATAMREVIERLVTSGAPEDELREAAVALERYAEHLETHPRLLRREGFGETSPAGDVAEFFDMSPLIGLSNPLSPPVELWTDENRAFGRVRFGSAYEGPPGHVHGGFIAAAFDEVLGYAQSLAENPGMTGRLTVHYRSPTPLELELRFEAWVERVEGRKTITRGELYAGELLCAEAEGLFVAIDRERFRALLD